MKASLVEQLHCHPFVPHPALKNTHAQTLAGSLLPRRTPLLSQNTEDRFFDPAPSVRVLAHCSWQPQPTASPTLILTHGLEGSSQSSYMLGTAEKALAAGFNVVRLNVRNCGGTAHLTETLYHAGLTDDLRAIVRQLSEGDGLKEIYLAGFSLGGNVSLKLAGEYGAQPPAALKGLVAVSPSLHLSSCAEAIELPSNFLYQLSFIISLKRSMRAKARLYPQRYDVSALRRIKTIRQFDDLYIAPQWGFRDASDYYEQASAHPHLQKITLPTLILHAQDDPFIPFAPFETEEVKANPNILLLAPARGGHVGFVAARTSNEDRFWAETKVVNFFTLLHSSS